MVYRRVPSRRGHSPELVIRTSGAGKTLVGLVLGGCIAGFGVVLLLVATAVEGIFGVLVCLVFGLVSTLLGLLLAVGMVVEAFKPIHIRLEDGELVLRQRLIFGTPRLEAVPLESITRVYIETETKDGDDGPVHFFRVVLGIADGDDIPLGGYHYISDLAEARDLAFRVERLLSHT